jgi:hypothetical protein
LCISLNLGVGKILALKLPNGVAAGVRRKRATTADPLSKVGLQAAGKRKRR